MELVNEEKHPPIVLFDGLCNLCSFAVQFILKYERNNLLHFASLQSNYGVLCCKRYAISPTPESIVLIENGHSYTSSEAVLKIARYMKWPFRWATFFKFLPRILNESVYRWVARNRYRLFGKRPSCYIPKAEYTHRFY